MQPDVCLTVVLDEADNFLVIRRSKRSTNAGRWEPPVGHREPGEIPEDAALREVAEETGLSVKLLSGTTDKRSDDGGGLRLFLARANGIKPEVKTEPSEHDVHKWLTLDEMNALEDCHGSLKSDISKLLKANSQTKEANMLPTMQSGMGLPFAPRFSGTYQPKLSGPPNPLASVKAPAVAKADAAGVQQALAKAGSMCLSATGEGPKRYKVNPEDAATGEKAFESLDRFKRAGLNHFQASFFSRMVNEGRDASQIKQAIAVAERRFGKKVAGELREGFSKLAGFGLQPENLKSEAMGALNKNLPEPIKQPPPAIGYPPIGGIASAGRAAMPHLMNAGKSIGQNLPNVLNTASKAAPAVAANAPKATGGWGSWLANQNPTAIGMGLGGAVGAATYPYPEFLAGSRVNLPPVPAKTFPPLLLPLQKLPPQPPVSLETMGRELLLGGAELAGRNMFANMKAYKDIINPPYRPTSEQILLGRNPRPLSSSGKDPANINNQSQLGLAAKAYAPFNWPGKPRAKPVASPTTPSTQKPANMLGLNKLGLAFASTAAMPQPAAKPSTAVTVPKIPAGGFKPFGTVPEKFQPKSRLSPLPKSQMPPPLSPEELYGKNKPIGPYDPSNIRAAGGIRFLPDQLINKNLEKTYLDKLQQYYNPASEQWQQETYLPEDEWNKNLSRAGIAATIPALAYAGSRIPGVGSALLGTAGGLGVTTYAQHSAVENLKTQLAPYLNQAGTALGGVSDIVTQLQNPKSELAQSYMGAMSDKLFEDPRLAKLMAIADKFDSGSGGLDLAGLFSKNQNWLIPLLAAFAAGGIGGGALGGTGGALGGAIGLPLIYYLMQNPEALSQFTGGAPGAQKPQATPPATPPAAQQQWPGPPHPYPAGA